VPNKVFDQSGLVIVPSKEKKFSPIIHKEYAVMSTKGGGLVASTVPLTQINSSNMSSADVQSK